MRKLMWFTLGFALASLAGMSGRLPFFGICAGILALGFCIGTRSCKFLRYPGAVMLGMALGFLWLFGYQTGYLGAAAELDGKELTAEFTAGDFSYPTDRGSTVDGTMELKGKPYRVRAYLNREIQAEPGDQITGIFRFRLTTAQGAQEPTWHQGKGIFLTAFELENGMVTPGDRNRRQDWPARFRRDLRNRLDACFPEDTAPFARALLLGDSSGLDDKTDADLQISGIRHVVAVSGLHVGMLYGLVRLLTLKKRWLTALVGTGILGLFAAVAGFTPSVTRACIMVELMMLASAFRREYDPLTELSFACLVMLMGNPMVITSVSFQLSAASVLGIILFGSRIREGLLAKIPIKKGRKRLKKWVSSLCSGISVSLSALVFVTPLCAWHFGTVSLVSVLTNFLTIWAVTAVFYGILLTCILSGFWTSGAALLGSAVSWGIRYVLKIAELLADFPLAAVYTRSPYIVAWVVLVYGLLGIFLLQKEKKPGLLLTCGGFGLALALMLSWAEPLTDAVRMTVFDVGQGQCILLQTEGKNFLVDCGGEDGKNVGDMVSQTLLSQGVGQVDGIILTHYDRDHIGGTPYLLDRIPADWILMPEAPEKVEFDTNCFYLQEQAEIRLERGKLTVFGGIPYGARNENSLCVLFEGENCDILITGDRSEFGERMLLRQASLPQVDYLLAGHHGAKTSTCQELLDTVRPDTVIISAGRDNPYGHPAPETLERLNQFGCRILRTDQNGTITIRR